jgi:hypothetical protein
LIDQGLTWARVLVLKYRHSWEHQTIVQVDAPGNPETCRWEWLHYILKCKYCGEEMVITFVISKVTKRNKLPIRNKTHIQSVLQLGP